VSTPPPPRPGRPGRPGRPARPARTPTSRPRRVAGHDRPGTVPDATAPAAEPEEVTLAKRAADRPQPVDVPVVAPARPQPAPSRTGRGPLLGLVAVVVLLLALVGAETWYLATDQGSDDEVGAVSGDRPVQVSSLTVRSVVDQAAKAADLIISATSDDYDAEVDAAAATMTDPFAAEFRETKAQVRDDFLAQQTQVAVDVSYQGVVSATATEVKALLFLTQTTQKGDPPQVTPVQYRVTVTMVDTEDGWLVSDLQAL
jgi:Mce-associated membrane protein